MKRPSPKTNEEQLKRALEHLDLRAAGMAGMQEELARMRALPSFSSSDRVNREAHAKAYLSLSRAQYYAGLLTEARCIHLITNFLDSAVLDGRLMDGDYDDDVGPISEKTKAIEREHGLSDDECWLASEGPPEWQEENRRFDEILDKKFAEILREFGDNGLADFWETDREEFDALVERGAHEREEGEDSTQALSDLADGYEREARICATNEAYYAACALVGACMEARLLLRCLADREGIREVVSRLPARHRPRSGNPTEWDLTTLLRVCGNAGWLPELTGRIATHQPEGWGYRVRDLRNLLHPGRYIRQGPRVSVGQQQFDDAWAAYTLVICSLQNKGEDNPQKSSEDSRI